MASSSAQSSWQDLSGRALQKTQCVVTASDFLTKWGSADIKLFGYGVRASVTWWQGV